MEGPSLVAQMWPRLPPPLSPPLGPRALLCGSARCPNHCRWSGKSAPVPYLPLATLERDPKHKRLSDHLGNHRRRSRPIIHDPVASISGPLKTSASAGPGCCPARPKPEQPLNIEKRTCVALGGFTDDTWLTYSPVQQVPQVYVWGQNPIHVARRSRQGAPGYS